MSARAYVSLHLIAEVCGLSEQEIHHQYRPEYWGVPRHWTFEGTRTLYAEDSLQDLVDSFRQYGAPAAAIQLRDWLRDRQHRATSHLGVPQASTAPERPWWKEGQFA
jgi:hypothetical protein